MTTTESNNTSKWTSWSPLALKLEPTPGNSPAAVLSYRHDWELSDQVTVTIGGNLYASRDPFKPYLGCKLSSSGDWALECNTQETVVLTPDVDLAKPLVSLLNRKFRKSEDASKLSFSLPIHARIGTEWGSDGKENQHVVDIGVKNKYVIAMVLVSSLLVQKPASVHVKRKEISGVKFNVGGAIPIGLGAVIDANLSREGRKLVVSFTDVPTPVIRTSEKFQARRS